VPQFAEETLSLQEESRLMKTVTPIGVAFAVAVWGYDAVALAGRQLRKW
jgi:hypothetical protein